MTQLQDFDKYELICGDCDKTESYYVDKETYQLKAIVCEGCGTVEQF